jgi:molybdopterin/thiamine biosynthesis adenylyltransferase/rhodanese-related sulfurtransferase
MTGPATPVRRVTVPEAIELARSGHRPVDVREPWEWRAGHVAGATHVPLADLPARREAEFPDRDEALLVYCRTGSRSGRAAMYLAANGYRNVANLADRIERWPQLGGAWQADEAVLTPAQRRRYGRQLLLPEVGERGQRRLLDAKVLLVGAGGLGSPVALYLGAAGVGTIGLVDDDLVDESNLQRQVAHVTARIGQPKTASARAAVEALNPETRVVEHRERFAADNAERLIGDYEVIVDGTDTFETRYVLNDAAVRLRRPVVHASVYRWEGQVTTFIPFVGPCYRCLHPVQPPEELTPDCALAGVMGVLPGMAGTIQAAEVLKLLLGVGTTLAGRLLLFDAASAEYREVRVERDPACPACGDAR